MKRRRHGNLDCCVEVCKNTYNNTSGEIKFYTFPKAHYKTAQNEQWKQWIRKTNGTPDWEPTLLTRICSEHFVGNQVSPMPTSPSYAPSIVQRSEPGILAEEASAIERFERSTKRRVYASKQAKCSDVEASPPIQIASTELPPVPVQIDKCLQTEMVGTTPEHKMTFSETITMICMQFVRNGVCEAQTQVFVPDKAIINIRRKRFRHKCVGTSIARIDKSTAYAPPNPRRAKTGLPHLIPIENDQQMLELCGVTMDTFQMLFSLLPHMRLLKKVSKEDRLFVVLSKLRSGISFAGMSVMYNIHRQTISKSFAVFLKAIRAISERYIQWPSREDVRNSMPEDFKQLYGDCRVMIHCMNVLLQPGGSIGRAETEANHGGSLKFLVGYTPNGQISFVSSSYNGRTSDCDLVKNSGILDLLEPGDVILADKMYPKIQEALHENGNVTLKVIPTFIHDPKFSAEKVDRMYQYARVKNHYERSVRRLKFYKALLVVAVDLIQYIPDMFFSCCALANLQLPNLLSASKYTQIPIEDDDGEDFEIAEGFILKRKINKTC